MLTDSQQGRIQPKTSKTGDYNAAQKLLIGAEAQERLLNQLLALPRAKGDGQEDFLEEDNSANHWGACFTPWAAVWRREGLGQWGGNRAGG